MWQDLSINWNVMMKTWDLFKMSKKGEQISWPADRTISAECWVLFAKMLTCTLIIFWLVHCVFRIHRDWPGEGCKQAFSLGVLLSIGRWHSLSFGLIGLCLHSPTPAPTESLLLCLVVNHWTCKSKIACYYYYFFFIPKVGSWVT